VKTARLISVFILKPSVCGSSVPWLGDVIEGTVFIGILRSSELRRFVASANDRIEKPLPGAGDQASDRLACRASFHTAAVTGTVRFRPL
jgi:hypothetical protein